MANLADRSVAAVKVENDREANGATLCGVLLPLLLRASNAPWAVGTDLISKIHQLRLSLLSLGLGSSNGVSSEVS